MQIVDNTAADAGTNFTIAGNTLNTANTLNNAGGVTDFSGTPPKIDPVTATDQASEKVQS